MRIALATCAQAFVGKADEEALEAALVARGLPFEDLSWDDPTVDWARYDAIVLRTVWDYHDKPEAFSAWLDALPARAKLFNPAPIVRWNGRKDYLRELEAAGVAIAPTRWLPAGERHDLARCCRELGVEARAFLKPWIGANASHTMRFDAARELPAAQAFLDELSPSRAMMLQPYLQSVEREGEYSLIYFADQLSHATRKIPVPGDYRVQDDWGASDEPWTPDASALALGEQTLTALAGIAGARGWDIELPLLYARVDLLRDERGAWVLNELELIEPSLFFRHDPQAAGRMVEALMAR